MSTKKSLSTACLDDLPDELLLEIHARVPAVTSMFPAKEATRLRAVSRSWNSIISSSDFIPRFISLGEENNCSWGNGEALLFSDIFQSMTLFYMVPSQCDPTVLNQPALDFSYISNDYIVIAASEDLLLLRECPWGDGPLVVCNPFTQRWAALPNPLDWGPNFVLVCDPQGHRYRVMSTKGRGECQDVFVSETGEWEEVPLTMNEFESNILPFRGKLFWYNSDGHFVSYDPFEGSFSFFPDPDPVHDSEPEDTEYCNRYYSLSVVHGSIRMLKFSSLPLIGEEQFYDLISWELDYKQERWSLIYKSSLCSYSCDNHYIDRRPITLHPDGHAVYFRTDRGLAFHDLSKGSNNLSKVWVKDELEDRHPLHPYEVFLLTRPWRPTSTCYGSNGEEDAVGMGGPWHLASEKVKAGGEFHSMCLHEEAGVASITSRGGSFEQMVNQHPDAIQPLPNIPVSTSNQLFKSGVKPALMVGVCLQIIRLLSGINVVLYYTPHKILWKGRVSVLLYRRSDSVSLLISVLTMLLMLLCIRGR